MASDALGRAGIGHAAVDAFMAERGLVRDVALVVPSFSAAAMVAASTDLVAGMTRRLAEKFLAMLPLRIVQLPFPVMTFQMQLLWHERTHADPGSRYFRELVLGCIAPRAKDARRAATKAPAARARRSAG